MARVLIGCEFSGRVRDAFKALGHDAWSCDLEASEAGGQHIQDDLLEVMNDGSWDIGIMHPPCTHLTVSGAKWFAQKRADGRQQQANCQPLYDSIQNELSRLSISFFDKFPYTTIFISSWIIF